MLDWIDGSKPFFILRDPSARALADLICCFLTAYYDPERLRAFMAGENDTTTCLDPFATNPQLLPSGCRVVFSFEEEPSAYGATFLSSDKTPRLSRWNIRLHRPARLPWIYEHAEPISLFPKQVTQLLPRSFKDRAFLVLITQTECLAVDLDRWGEEGAVLFKTFDHEFREISWIAPGLSPQSFFVVGDGELYQGDIETWDLRRNSLALFPSQGELSSQILACCSSILNPNTYFFVSKKGEIFLSTPHSVERIHHLEQVINTSAPRYDWLQDGSILFLTGSGTGLNHAPIQGGNISTIIDLQEAGRLFFCRDRYGILYVLESMGSRRLHLLFPPGHWVCSVCGMHRPNAPGKNLCPNCQANVNRGTLHTFQPWLDIDLSTLGTVVGPVAVDEALNLFVVSNSSQITSIALSRRDVWAESKD